MTTQTRLSINLQAAEQPDQLPSTLLLGQDFLAVFACCIKKHGGWWQVPARNPRHRHLGHLSRVLASGGLMTQSPNPKQTSLHMDSSEDG